MTFTETLELHLGSIQQRNLDQFLSTLTTRDELTLLTLSGLLINWRKDFIETMTSWFADPDWSIQFETIRSYKQQRWALRWSLSATTTKTHRAWLTIWTIFST